ncbi:MAG: type II toxin-antitoxin system mRNA interferase toxin, RelE/StbE family [Nanoarchaeota archaeon]|nr:type II toxin-antitoxin system mRNA interferase toxin, RelE/StbE family [Nanoarchaeota archaeon]
MTVYSVVVSPEFERQFQRLDKKIQERVRKILKELETRLLGEPLKGDLKGFYSVHFENNHYRLVYAKEDSILQVMAIHVGKKTNDFYKNIKEYIKRKNKLH